MEGQAAALGAEEEDAVVDEAAIYEDEPVDEVEEPPPEAVVEPAAPDALASEGEVVPAAPAPIEPVAASKHALERCMALRLIYGRGHPGAASSSACASASASTARSS